MDLSLGNGSTLIAVGTDNDESSYLVRKLMNLQLGRKKINMIMHRIKTNYIDVKMGDSLLNDVFSALKLIWRIRPVVIF